MTGREHVVVAAEYVPLEVELVLCAQPGFARHLVRDRVLAELRPGSTERPGYFHPDRLSFGDAVRLGDLLAFVQGIAGVRSVEATIFRPLGDTTGPAVRDIILLGRTKVARLDADPDFPEHGTLEVLVDRARLRRPRCRRLVGRRCLAHHRHRPARGGSPQLRIRAVGGIRPDGDRLAHERRGGRRRDRARGALLRRGADRRPGRRDRSPTRPRAVCTCAREADGDVPNNLLALPELPDD